MVNDRIRLTATGTPRVLLDEWKFVQTKNSGNAVVGSFEEDDDFTLDSHVAFSSANNMPSCTPSDPNRIVEMAIATDYLFCSVWSGGSCALAEGRVRSLFLEVNTKFAAASCVLFSPTYIETNCLSAQDDPWIPNVQHFAGEEN